MSGWIPVSERLPAIDEWVLVYAAADNETPVWIACHSGQGYWSAPEDLHEYAGPDPDDSDPRITHWMRLPQPPVKLLDDREVPCHLVFKSIDCRYAGPETTCDKRFATCRRLGNQENYRGMLKVPE